MGLDVHGKQTVGVAAESWHIGQGLTDSARLASGAANQSHVPKLDLSWPDRGATPLNPHRQSICAKKGYKKAVVVIAQRLRRIFHAMWRKGEDFEVAQLNVVHRLSSDPATGQRH